MKAIKKLSLVFTILLFACSKSGGDIWNSDYTPSTKTYFSPPSWIQGVWVDDNINLKFTNNDFIVRSVSYNERINFLSTKYLNCTEQKSSSNYKITILHLSINQDIYDFEFVSDIVITCRYESGTVDDWFRTDPFEPLKIVLIEIIGQ